MSRERPILFSAPMVRALLAGKKTQTRRLYKPLYPAPYEIVDETPAGEAWPFRCDEYGDYRFRASPYGVVGDRLWVRETWNTSGNHESALAALGRDSHDGTCFIFAADYESPGKGWRPSIFMPRGASRISLDVLSVCFQRLQDISEEDAKAEGVQPFNEAFECISPDQPIAGLGRAGDAPYRASYAVLWDEINADRANWNSNPWVWVVSFPPLATHAAPTRPPGGER